MRGGLRAVGAVAKAAAYGIVTAGAAVGALSVKFVGLAMDAAETESKFKTVFGSLTAEVSAFVSSTNQKFGIPTKELQDAASTFGVFAKAASVPQDKLASFSTSLTQAGLDLASFYNADPGEVFQALRSGLAGEAEPLRKFGIFISDATLKAKAAQMGFKKELTESQKVMVRHAIIMGGLGDANGDLARTSGGLANQWRAVKGRFQEAGTTIGTALLPYATALSTEINKRMIPVIQWLKDKFPPILDTIAAKFASLKKTFDDAGGGMDGLKAVVDRVFGAGSAGTITAAKDAFASVGKTMKEDIGPAVAKVTPSMDTLKGIFNWFQDHPKAVAVIAGMGGALVLLAKANKAANQQLILTLPLRAAELTATVLSASANKALAFQLSVLTGVQRRGIISMIASKVATVATTVATGAWTAAQWLLNAALTANPIGLVVVAIALLAAGLIYAYRHSQTFRDIVQSAFAVVKGAALGVFNFFKTNWHLIMGFITGPVAGAVSFVIEKWDSIVRFFGGLKDRIGTAAAGMWDGLKSTFKGVINWIIDKWNALDFGIPSISVPGFGKVGGVGDIVPDIPRLHSGGTVRSPGLAIIKPDEEMVRLPAGAGVQPMPVGATVGASVAGGGASGPVVLQVMLDRRVLAEAVYDDIRDRAARR